MLLRKHNIDNANVIKVFCIVFILQPKMNSAYVTIGKSTKWASRFLFA